MKSKLNTLKFDQMGEEMFETKVIPWIASSKSSDQINRLLFPAHLLLREFRVGMYLSFLGIKHNTFSFFPVKKQYIVL